jgi:sugar phosphate isomerase/epimerase
MANFIISAFADEYDACFDEQLKALSMLGIGNIEIRHVDGKNVSVLDMSEVKAASAALDRAGISVSAIGSPIGKIKLDADISEHIEMARRVFEYANIFGAKYVRAFSFYAPDGKKITDMRGEVLSGMERLVTLARKYGVVLCHENEANIYGDIPQRCTDLLDHFGGELKCVFDMGNFVLEGVEPYAAYEKMKKHVAYFHIKDALYEGAIVPAGKGEARIKEILTAHKAYAGEDFFVSLEPHLETFSGLNALVGRSFKNPYKYADAKSAFVDAVNKFKELI